MGRPQATRSSYAAWLLPLALLCAPTLASQAARPELPSRWQIHGDGRTGSLELIVESSGTVSGTLIGRDVTGFLAGRHLVLHRTTEGRAEVWDGWLPGAADSEPFVAGTVTVSDRGGSRVHPWYAVPDLGTVGGPPPAATAVGDSVAEVAEAAPEPEPPAPDRPAPSAADGWAGWNLSGVWMASDGRVEIAQQQRSLSVVMPDGARHAGRFTAMDTIVVGLRKGCCKGQIQSSDMIRWSDGATWRRID